MSCDQCREREAVIHLTQIVNEQVTTLHLCERCAAEKGVESPGSAVKTPLGSFLAAMGKGPEQAASPRAADTCLRCGATFQDFRESGRLGCPDCYRTFEAPLRDLLRRLHGSTHHLGERYAERQASSEEAREKAADLREQLRLAVETENFELAAELRDRLKVME
jgi:protein arginine kinase activator